MSLYTGQALIHVDCSDCQRVSQEEQPGRHSDRMNSADPSEPFGESESEETSITNQAMALGNLEDAERWTRGSV